MTVDFKEKLDENDIGPDTGIHSQSGQALDNLDTTNPESCDPAVLTVDGNIISGWDGLCQFINVDSFFNNIITHLTTIGEHGIYKGQFKLLDIHGNILMATVECRPGNECDQDLATTPLLTIMLGPFELIGEGNIDYFTEEMRDGIITFHVLDDSGDGVLKIVHHDPETGEQTYLGEITHEQIGHLKVEGDPTFTVEDVRKDVDRSLNENKPDTDSDVVEGEDSNNTQMETPPEDPGAFGCSQANFADSPSMILAVIALLLYLRAQRAIAQK